MTSSTPNIGYENEEKPTVNIGINEESSTKNTDIDQNLQEVISENQTSTNTTEEQQPEVEFENVFDNKKIFNMDKSWIDWDTEYNFSDYTNTFNIFSIFF